MTNKANQVVRISSIVIAILMLVWLPFEDAGPTIPIAFGILITFILSGWLIGKDSEKHNIPGLVGYSLLLASTFVIVPSLLMIFKSGLHNHGFPDFPISDLIFIWNLLPLVIVVALALGATYFLFARKNS